MKNLIDGDVVVYKAGFASDQVTYWVQKAKYQYKKDANTYADSINFPRDNIEKTVEHEPLEYCLSSVKKMMEKMHQATDADEKLVLLTGPANFRFDLYPEYKSSRKDARRPHHYDAIHEYLIDVHAADKVVGVEADDALGWHQWADFENNGRDPMMCETCICTIDKDLNMIPGWHHNFNWTPPKADMYWIDLDDANQWFFQQWLSGDPADDIPGLSGVAEKTAQKILADVPKNVFDMYSEVMRRYKVQGKFDTKMVHTIGDLLWMQRTPGDTWDKHLGLEDERQKAEV